jgi:hypothetical protein
MVLHKTSKTLVEGEFGPSMHQGTRLRTTRGAAVRSGKFGTLKQVLPLSNEDAIVVKNLALRFPGAVSRTLIKNFD